MFLDQEDVELHRVIRAIALNSKLSRLNVEDVAHPTDFLLAPEQLAKHFPHCPEALTNTARIAEHCRSDWDFSRTVFPAFGSLANAEAFAELERRARQGAIRRYGHIGDQVDARLGKELAIIRDKGFSHYFPVVEDIAKQSPRTCGRGSAAASLVASHRPS